MKVAVFRDNAKLEIWDASGYSYTNDSGRLVGYIDLPIEKPKEDGVSQDAVEQLSRIDKLLDELDTLNGDAPHRAVGRLTRIKVLAGHYVDKPKKKLVTKEAVHLPSIGNGHAKIIVEKFSMPSDAKNIRCTYEVED